MAANVSHPVVAQTNFYSHLHHHDQQKFFLDPKASDFEQYSDDSALLKKVEGLKEEKEEAV